MDREKFEKLVNEGIRAIPKRFLEKLDNVEIVIEDEPAPEQLRKLKAQKSLLIFGLYEGVPQTKREHYGQVLPDKITIFQKPIEEMARSEEEAKRTSSLLHLHPATRESVIKEIVKNTVWHEIAHHFGMDEKKVREAEYQRRKLKP
jgi:predicted Zn-dependent protease with MMP-like domain